MSLPHRGFIDRYRVQGGNTSRVFELHPPTVGAIRGYGYLRDTVAPERSRKVRSLVSGS